MHIELMLAIRYNIAIDNLGVFYGYILRFV